MLFNSFSFLLFFPIVTILYFVLPHKYRWALLLAASSIFYMAFIPVYILILICTIVVDYFAAIYIDRSDGLKKKIYLNVSIVATCLILFVFKYFNFFAGSVNSFAHFFNLNYSIDILNIILPIGLSFHTFQSLSYVIEVYRGKQKPERHFGIYSLYVMFYPQLVAGPIERPQNLLHQFWEEHHFEYNRVVDGLKLMAWGLFKKVVIADRLSMFVNEIYNSPDKHNPVTLAIATVFFAFQIYCDFSGYSDIAIGSARVMGFKLMQNFNRPYFSKSISEFWKRWHISLSTWFTDYLYISLGGNRVPKWRWQFNLFFTFLVSGLWHGAKWTFVIWGALNGFYLIFSLWMNYFRNKFFHRTKIDKNAHWLKYPRIIITFVLTCFAWIFFRANSVNDALHIANSLFAGVLNLKIFNFVEFSRMLEKGAFNYSISDFALSIIFVTLMIVIQMYQRRGRISEMLSSKPIWLKWTVYYAFVLVIIIFGVYGKQEFIYFQF